MPPSIADRQCPSAGELFLDHVTHRVADLAAATELLHALGFTPTPRSPYAGPATRPGAANCCVMLEEGYFALLAPVAAAPRRPSAVHALIFGTPQPEAEHARLLRHGFAPLPLETVEREVERDGAPGRARLAVVRVPEGTMPEGNLRFALHLTPAQLWQPRWLTHDNGVTALVAAFVVADDAPAVAARYARFCGLLPRPAGPWVRLVAARGELMIGTRADWQALLGAAPPAPAFAGYALACRDARAFAARCARAGIEARSVGDGLYAAPLPPALGGAWLFGERAALERWRAAPLQ